MSGALRAAALAWTPERQALLARLAQEGKTAGQAGKVMGLSRSAVLGRAKRTGVRFHGRMTAEEKSEQTRRSAKTRAHRQAEIIAKAVATKAAKGQVRPRRQAWTQQDDETIRRLAGEGSSLGAAAAELGCSRAAVSGRASRLKVAFKSNGGGNLNTGPKQARPYVEPLEPAGSETLLSLKAHHCRWPIGDPRSDTLTFCGADKVRGAYCAPHAQRAYAAEWARPAVFTHSVHGGRRLSA